MTSAEMVTDFKIRQDFYETPVGVFSYHAHAVEACVKSDFLPDVITHRVEMAECTSLMKALNKFCGHLAEEYNFAAYKFSGVSRIPEKYWNLVAFSVEGQSEGYYVHIGVITRAESYNETPRYIDLGVAKTYSPDSAHKLAMEASRFLAATQWN